MLVSPIASPHLSFIRPCGPPTRKRRHPSEIHLVKTSSCAGQFLRMYSASLPCATPARHSGDKQLCHIFHIWIGFAGDINGGQRKTSKQKYTIAHKKWWWSPYLNRDELSAPRCLMGKAVTRMVFRDTQLLYINLDHHLNRAARPLFPLNT